MRSALLLAGLAFFGLANATAGAQPFDPAQVEAGMAIYKPAAANCEPCHGYGGAGALALDELGGKGTAFGPGLVASKMTRAEMVDVVSCGVRNDWLTMPQYLQKAWTRERPCYGKVLADLNPEESPLLAPRPLTEAQIEAVVTYVQAFYQGSPMTYDKCVKYWGDRSPACGIFPR